MRNPHLNQIPPDGTRAHERNRWFFFFSEVLFVDVLYEHINQSGEQNLEHRAILKYWNVAWCRISAHNVKWWTLSVTLGHRWSKQTPRRVRAAHDGALQQTIGNFMKIFKGKRAPKHSRSDPERQKPKLQEIEEIAWDCKTVTLISDMWLHWVPVLIIYRRNRLEFGKVRNRKS